jgi:3-oxoacyl-(acyl-carrier-protein) synthase
MGVISGAGNNVAESMGILQEKNFRPTPMTSDTCVIKLAPPTAWCERFSPPTDLLFVNLLALIATQEALDSAGFTAEELKTLRVGVCIGSTVGCSNFQEVFTKQFCLGENPHPGPVTDVFKTNTAQFLSRHFQLRGPKQMISNACTSGGDAIGIGAGWLQADLCDVVICGGAEEALTSIYYGFKSLLLCSSKPCQPFDKYRQGLNLGDGAGIVILEKPGSKRSALAKLLGWGFASDSYHPTAPHPEARGLTAAIDTAFSRAGISRVDFINTHGTATMHNDQAEANWIKSHAPDTEVVATKGYTGHTLGAAGAVEAVFTTMSLMEQKLPATRGFQDLDPLIGFAPTLQIATGDFKTGLSTSLGFGGTNTALVFGRAD